MSKARLVITAVTLEKRTVAEVATTYGVARSWVYELLARYRDEGEAAFEPRSKAPPTSSPKQSRWECIPASGKQPTGPPYAPRRTPSTSSPADLPHRQKRRGPPPESELVIMDTTYRRRQSHSRLERLLSWLLSAKMPNEPAAVRVDFAHSEEQVRRLA